MKFLVVLTALFVAPACSGTRQDQRDGDSSNHFSVHQGNVRLASIETHGGKSDPHAGGSGDDGGGWAAGLLSGFWDFLFSSNDPGDPSF